MLSVSVNMFHDQLVQFSSTKPNAKQTYMLGQALKTVNTLIVSGGQGSSDNQTVAAISDALMTVSSSNGAAPAAGVNMSEWAATGWEQLLEGFLDWLSMESAAMKCDNPIAPSIKKLVEGAEVNQPLDLGETVIKHLAFNKISEAWDATCSCGEHRTEWGVVNFQPFEPSVQSSNQLLLNLGFVD